MDLRKASFSIIGAAIKDAMPDASVEKALKEKTFPGRINLVAIGKAAWQMANAAHSILERQI